MRESKNVVIFHVTLCAVQVDDEIDQFKCSLNYLSLCLFFFFYIFCVFSFFVYVEVVCSEHHRETQVMLSLLINGCCLTCFQRISPLEVNKPQWPHLRAPLLESAFFGKHSDSLTTITHDYMPTRPLFHMCALTHTKGHQTFLLP